MTHLRWYQQDAINDLVARWDAGAVRVPQVLATGLGKGEIAAGVEARWRADLAARYGLGKRILVLAHTDEICDQLAKKARQRNPHLSVGVVKAGRNETHCQVIISSRQTMASERRRAQVNGIGLIIIDECHHALASNTYGTILRHFGAFDEVPRVKVYGLTATLARSNSKEKLSTVWEKVTFSKDILFGIRNGFLLDVTGKSVIVPDFDLSRVRQSGGDYRGDDIAEELERTYAPEIIGRHYNECARTPDGELRRGVAFWPLVNSAYYAAEAWEKIGIPSGVIHGQLSDSDRRLVLKRRLAGDIKVIHNAMVLTEGFDAPDLDVVVVGRPTRSPLLWQQMVGRGLRPDLTVEASKRPKALILDAVSAASQHDLCSLIDLSPERKLSRPDTLEELSLLQLDEWATQHAEEFADPTFVAPHDGPTEVVAFDPLHRERAWQSTPGGTFFMSAGEDAYVFLAESASGDPGSFDVVWCAKDARGGAGLTQYLGLPLEEALLCAEDAAIARGGHGTKTLTSRRSRWRKGQPTDKQVFRAAMKGIVVPRSQDGAWAWTSGQVSEAIDLAEASQRIDPLVRAVVEGRRA